MFYYIPKKVCSAPVFLLTHNCDEESLESGHSMSKFGNSYFSCLGVLMWEKSICHDYLLQLRHLEAFWDCGTLQNCDLYFLHSN